MQSNLPERSTRSPSGQVKKDDYRHRIIPSIPNSSGEIERDAQRTYTFQRDRHFSFGASKPTHCITFDQAPQRALYYTNIQDTCSSRKTRQFDTTTTSSPGVTHHNNSHGEGLYQQRNCRQTQNASKRSICLRYHAETRCDEPTARRDNGYANRGNHQAAAETG